MKKSFEQIIEKTTAKGLETYGFKAWDEPVNGQIVMLIPVDWYDTIPQGFPLIDIFDKKIKFDKRKHHKEGRFGVLPYGVIKDIK